MNNPTLTQTTHQRPDRGTRLRGMLATIAIVGFTLGVPTVLVAIGATPNPGVLSWSRLTGPDDGTVALQVITIVCWVAWAVFTCQLVAAIVSTVRGIRAPRLPGLTIPQLAADHLVAAAALLFMTVPVVAAALPQPRAEAAVAAPIPQTPPRSGQHGTHATPNGSAHGSAETATTATGPPRVTARATSGPATEHYTVKRGDSLWRIAEERLGDGTRYTELVDLNHDALNGRPDFLLPGTVLQVPTTNDAAADEGNAAPADEYVVQPGDTLFGIAEQQLGDATAYPRIAEASESTRQTNGAHLTDPDVILPGWTLTIPSNTEATSTRPAPPPRQRLPGSGEGRTQPASPRPAAPAPGTVSGDAANDAAGKQADTAEAHDDADRASDHSPDGASDDVASDASDQSVVPAWLLPGLAGASGVFGAGLWVTLRQKRRTQLRYRRPGTILRPPPDAVLPAEKTARASASIIAPRIDQLDAALRGLAPRPRLVTATLSDQRIVVTLAEDTDLPAPWTGSGREWQIAPSEVALPAEDSFPPYPLLVGVGQRSDGAYVFVNLEELRTITVTGDAERKASFARHLAAELAVNPWSAVTTVEVLGLGADLAEFNLGRVRSHPAGDTRFITQLARDLAQVSAPRDPDDFCAAIIATSDRPEDAVAELRNLIRTIPGRSAAVLIDLAAEPDPSDVHMALSDDGHLTITIPEDNTAAGSQDDSQAGSQACSQACSQVGSQVDAMGGLWAAGLSGDEARACALLLDLTLDTHGVAVPPDPHNPVRDLGGALREPLVAARPTGPVGERSLLPLEAEVYADAAATTIEDIEAVAPVVAPEARSRVEKADPRLDEDLALWESPTCAATKLTLLGPVGATTGGDTKATAHRRPFYVELLTYLTLHPDGVPALELTQAFGLRIERVRVDISALRRWLGNDPRTDKPYLPRAGAQPGSEEPARYRLEGILCDLDLFRRLRTRGQARGAAGLDDLIAALRLVSGEPFTGLREGHWTWLADGERWDHIMSCAIVDVGHIVTTHALADGDPELALWAATIAYSAAPYDEVAQLDVIAAEKATGDEVQAEADLRAKVLDRRDDSLPPVDPCQRTKQIIDAQEWLPARSRRTG